MRIVLVCAVFFVLAACRKDEPEPEVIETIAENPAPTFEFKNQELQGEIEGKVWRFVSGSARNHAFGDSSEFSINLYAETDSNICRFSPTEDRVLFSIPKEEEVFELSLSFTGEEESYTVTLFDVEATNNLIASQGAVQVIRIDSSTSTKSIVLDLDVRYNADNFVNGRCTIPICD